MIRYNRFPSKELLDLFKRGEILNPLTKILKCKDRSALQVFDVQFREKDSVSIYCGATEVVEFKFRDNHITFSATETYLKQSCASKLNKQWGIGKDLALDFKNALFRYLEQVKVNVKYWNKEGQVQVRWEQKCGRNWNPELPFLIFDREAVLGYTSKQDKQRNQARFKKEMDSVVNSVVQVSTKKLAVPKRNVSNELDLIGIGEAGQNLVLIEAKSGLANASEIYYSPLQVLYYIRWWKNALESKEGNQIIDDINRLIEAKKCIGLLPNNAPSLIKDAQIRLQPVIVVDKLQCSGEVINRLRDVVLQVNKTADNLLKNLKIWEYPEGENPKEYRLNLCNL